MERLNGIAAFLERNPGLADCVVQITYSEIYDIAEAFRALEKEAQKNLEGAFAWQNRAEAAEAKLADLAKQEAVAYLTWHQGFRSPDDCEDYLVVASNGDKSCDGSKAFPVFNRPAPAADLADSVKLDAIRYRFLRERDFFGADDEPGLATWDELCDLNCNEFDAAVDARMNQDDSLYPAILRNIEEN